MWVTDGILGLLLSLISQGGLIVVFAILLFRVQPFRKVLAHSNRSVPETLLLILFFSGMGILGTYTGIPIQGALANSRVVGVFVGGLVGGPVVGIFSGVIAGFHRWAIDIGGFTSFSCMLSTIVEGLLAAYLHQRFMSSQRRWLFGFFAGILAETLQMIIILLTARPFPAAVDLVSIIGIPMILGNAVGISMFVAISETLEGEEQKIAARQSQKVLEIVETTLPFFRQGYTPLQAQKTAQVILEELSVAAVAFTDTEQILSHVGLGEDHHLSGMPILTDLTRRAISEGTIQVANERLQISCPDPDCQLKSAVIAPLMRSGVPIGALKLYKEQERAITQVDIEVAKGLASLLSLQIELSELDKGERLLAKARLRALQSQINPHFLFNAMNTISSLISEDQQKAKELLLNLSDFYRSRLQLARELIPLHNELETIEAYMQIEKARFGEKISLSYDIEGEDGFLIPPLILQPIVENAVKHGLQRSMNPGTVLIRSRIEGRSAILTVIDDGVGMDEERQQAILSEEDPTHGLSNVHHRLINLYGRGSGLRIVSQEGEGTEVWLQIPLSTES